MNEHQVHHHHLGPHAHIMNPEMEAVHTETTEVLLSLLSQNKALSGESTHKLNTYYRRILVFASGASLCGARIFYFDKGVRKWSILIPQAQHVMDYVHW